MGIDYSLFAFPKGQPAIAKRAKKQKAEASAWRKTSKAVDTRDEHEGSPRCFITGKRLQTDNPLDQATFRDRAHIEARSTNKRRRFDDTNVFSCSRLVHRAVDRGLLFLLTEKREPARTVQQIQCVAWNRRWVARKEEPFRIRKGLAVVELDQVKD